MVGKKGIDHQWTGIPYHVRSFISHHEHSFLSYCKAFSPILRTPFWILFQFFILSSPSEPFIRFAFDAITGKINSIVSKNFVFSLRTCSGFLCTRYISSWKPQAQIVSSRNRVAPCSLHTLNIQTTCAKAWCPLAASQKRATLLIRQLLHKFQLALPHAFIFHLPLPLGVRFQELASLLRSDSRRRGMSSWFSRLRSAPLFRQYGWYIVGVPTLAGLIYINNKVWLKN